MKERVNIILSTDVDGKGGIASVLKSYRLSGLMERWNIYLIKTHSEKSNFLGFYSFYCFVSSFFKVLYRLFTCDVGFFHVHMSKDGSYLRKSLLIKFVKVLGGKVIIHLHSGSFPEFYNKSSGKVKADISKVFNLADRVIVIAHIWKVWVSKIIEDKEKIRIIYNTTPRLIEKRKCEVGKVVFMGRFAQEKGIFDLIHAFYAVLQELPEAKLVLAGDGDVKKCETLVAKLGIAKSVKFVGWVSDKDKTQLLTSADVYCQPSYFEALGLSIIEAISAGVPIVSTSVGGIPDVVSHMEEGILVEPGNIEQLSKSLIYMIRNRSFNELCSISAERKFKKTFDSNMINKQLDKIYDEVLKERKV